VDVVEANREKNRVRLKTSCVNQHGEEVLVGEAVVKPSRTPVRYERTVDPAAALTLWALAPWAWVAQGAAGAFAWSVLALTVPRR
jgi:hypothetical protein